MKKYIFSLVLFIAAICTVTAVQAQSTSPRFGTAKNQDNTARVLTFKTQSLTDAAGADSATIEPNAWHTIVQVAALDSFTLKSPTVTNCSYGDQLVIYVTGTSGDKLKFTGTNWASSGTATLSSVAKAIIEFFFDGAKWTEKTRTVQ